MKSLPGLRALSLYLATIAILALLAIAPIQASAARPLPVAAQQSQARPLSLDEAATMVQQRVGGRVLAADARQGNGKTYYEIRILVKKGQIKVYRVDPDSGRIY